MRIAVGSDHAGLELRALVAEHLRAAGHEVREDGPQKPESVDYPLFAERVARAVAAGEVERGVLVCGTGIGMSMAANRIKGPKYPIRPGQRLVVPSCHA